MSKTEKETGFVIDPMFEAFSPIRIFDTEEVAKDYIREAGVEGLGYKVKLLRMQVISDLSEMQFGSYQEAIDVQELVENEQPE